MNVLLINLPLTEFTQPHIALPIIRGYLNKYSPNTIVKQIDLNVELANYLFSKKTISDALEYAKSQNIEGVVDNFNIYNNLKEGVEYAKKIFSSRKYFYDYFKYIYAMETIRLSLKKRRKIG